MMDQRLKNELPQLSLESLHELDRGKLARQFRRAIARAMQNISEFPCKGEKVESREISIVLKLTPEVKFNKISLETAMGQAEALRPEIIGISAACYIKDKFPIFQTDDVRMAIDIVNDQITDVRFNPNNNNRPDQLELDLDE